MTTIRLYRHPFADAPPEVFVTDSLGQWLLDRYEGLPRVGVQVFAGEPSAETDISDDVQAILRSDAPEYVVLESPGMQFLPQIAQAIVSMLVSAAISALLKPDPVGLTNRDQQSPNNQLANRENQVRAMQRVEDIYGTVRAIPSLMMPTYVKYIAHQKVEYGYYCIGRGYYDVTDVRDGDTEVSAVTGTSAVVYAPFTSPNSGSPQIVIGSPIIDPVLTVSRSNAVDGIALKPTNQLQLTPSLHYGFFGPGPGSLTAGIPPSAADIIQQPPISRRPNFAAVAEAGQTLTVSMAPVLVLRDNPLVSFTASAGAQTFTASAAGFFHGTVIGSAMEVTGFGGAPNDGTKTVAAVSPDGSTVTVVEALADAGPVTGQTFEVLIDYSGTRTISSVENGFIILSGAPQISTQDYPLGGLVEAGAAGQIATLTVANSLTDWTDWVTLPSADRTEVWTNVLALQGMYKDDGAKSTTSVAYEVQIEQLTPLFVPTGVVETVSGSLTGSTSQERAETLERVTAWVGPARVRARRTTPFDYDFGGLVVDEITWVDLYSVSPVSKPHFGNKTTIHTVTPANSRAVTIRRRELNCLVSRKLPTYNGAAWSGAFDADGLLVSGVIAPTSRITDIIAAVTIDPYIGNRDISELDVTQVYTTWLALDAWNPECGQFNYTFDSDSISFEDTVTTIANAAFCTAYRQNGVIRLALDRPQAQPVAMFMHRNKRPRAETVTRTFANDSEYDGIELAYMDPETETQETIRLPLGGGFTKLKKVEVPGIRSYEQAWLRANRELNRLRYQRISIEGDTTTDARALLPNSRILWVDNTRFRSYDGEVIAQSGLTLTLSRDVEFVPAHPHSIVLQKRDGSLQAIACAEVAGSPNKVLLAVAPAEALVTTQTPESGIRTSFSFAVDSARGGQAALVQEIGVSDGTYIHIRAINYADEYYQADEEPIPDKSGVIN